MRKLFFFCILYCLIINTSSCFDAKEIDDYAFVLAMGIDKGKDDSIILTLQLNSMETNSNDKTSSSSSDGGESGGKFAVISIESNSFYTAINMINASLPRRINFMQMKYLVFSEELAKLGVITNIAPLIRDRQIRRHVHIIVSKGNASEFIKENKPIIGSSLSKSMELMAFEPENIGYFNHITFNEFYDGLKSSYRQSTAILGAVNNLKNLEKSKTETNQNIQKDQYTAGELIREGGNKIEFYGTAIFDGDKMVSELSGEETRLLMFITGDFKRGYFSIKDPLEPIYNISIDVRSARDPKIEFELENNKPVFNIMIRLEGDMLSSPSILNYETPEFKPILENAFKEKIKKDMDALITKCQSLKTDIFGLGDYVCWNFMTIQDWEKFDWKSQFANADINIKIEFNIRRTGTMLKNSPIVDSGTNKK